MAVGIIERGRRRVIVYGTHGSADTRSIVANTLFDIGSVTKVFTALLLADMVHRQGIQFEVRSAGSGGVRCQGGVTAGQRPQSCSTRRSKPASPCWRTRYP
jgi:hypothetical protein